MPAARRAYGDIVTVHQLNPEAASFDQFWKGYPRKIDKALAQAKWTAITNGGLSTRMLDRDSGQFVPIMLRATAVEILAGLARFRDNLPLDYDEKFIPHPATWLNRGRWMD